MSERKRSLLYRTAVACAISVALAPSTASAQTERVSSGPVEAIVPTGNAQPLHAASPAQIAVKPTSTAAERLAASRAPVTAHRGGAAAPSAAPSFQIAFEGTNQTQGLRPPDTHGAVGATQFVEVTNSKIEVFSKLNGFRQSTRTLNSFCGYNTQTIFDPRVVYDKIWNRWIVVAEAFKESSTSQILCLAVSLSSNANGAFFIYRFQAPRGSALNFYDYPMVGMDQDAIIITANIFNSSDVYQFSNLFAVAKADLYNGRGFSVPVFNLVSGTMAPPIVETNDTVVMVLSRGGSSGTIQLRKFTNLGRLDAAFLGTTNVDVTDYTASFDANQFGTNNLLDVLDRFQDHSTQIRRHVLNTSTVRIGCGIEGSCPTPRWWQINGGTNTQVASGLFYEAGTSHDFNPAIAGSPVGGTSTNPIGRMFFTWTATQPFGAGGHNARVKGSGRLRTDGLITTGGSSLNAGGNLFYNPSGAIVERWGDYSSVTLDPTPGPGCPAGNRAYIVNEKINTVNLWGSRVGRFGFC